MTSCQIYLPCYLKTLLIILIYMKETRLVVLQVQNSGLTPTYFAYESDLLLAQQQASYTYTFKVLTILCSSERTSFGEWISEFGEVRILELYQATELLT